MRTSTRLFTLATLFLAAACSAGKPPANPPSPILPDSRLTPGDALNVTKADVCVSGYSSKVRDVPDSVKQQVYVEYHIVSHQPKEYEVDHLISLELGGSNAIKNLWPQSYETQPWNAHIKDKLENHLHKLVCDGAITLKAAQQEIAKDWIASYKKRFPNDIPKAAFGSGGHVNNDVQNPGGINKNLPKPSEPGGKSGQATPARVWVNLDSGIYFRSGSQYYGKTKNGKYLTEKDAIKAGYYAAKSQ